MTTETYVTATRGFELSRHKDMATSRVLADTSRIVPLCTIGHPRSPLTAALSPDPMPPHDLQ